MENKILYQIIIGGIFYFLVALALYTFLKEPKQILKDLAIFYQIYYYYFNLKFGNGQNLNDTIGFYP